MRFVKGISLFFIYPVVLMGIGFSAGVLTMDFFYPYTYVGEKSGQRQGAEQSQEPSLSPTDNYGKEEALQIPDREESGLLNDAIDVAASEDILNADTEYTLQEIDLVKETMVENIWQIPGEYIGMNRKQFLESMEDYEAYPPLSELERGFVSLEVISFSAEKVVVQMYYLYVQPGKLFYLAVQDNEVIVLLEDKRTVYINTGILLDSLPEAVQLELIQMFAVEGEEELYDFLEFYSS